MILGVARMNAVLETDYDNRFIRVQTGRTNLSVTGAVEAEGFFYAPDPSSQLACAIAGNIAMNSGGAHCLKYGVTTNNLLGVTLVQMDGTVVEIGGPCWMPAGLDLLGVICGSEGQLGVVTEATLRILPKPEGARPVLIGFDIERGGGGLRRRHHQGRASCRWRSSSWTAPASAPDEAFAQAGYPDCEALLIVEVEGSEAEIDEQLAGSRRSRGATTRWSSARAGSEEESQARSGWAASRPSARWGRSTITCVWTGRSRSARCPSCCAGSAR